MRIGLLTQYYKPEMGAPQNRLYEMMRGLRELGHEVCIVTAMPNYPTGEIFPQYKGRWSMTHMQDGIETRRYWLFASNSRRVIPRVWNMLSFSFTSFFALRWLRKKKLDYLIVESPPLTLAWTGALLAKLAGAKYVANISDIWPLSAKELGAISDGFLYRMLEKLERGIYRKAHIAMGQSQEIVDHIAAHGGRNVYLFRNGVDPGRFEGITKTKANPVPQIIYAGLLGFAQGIADICRNVDFRKLGVDFHIYGAGGEADEIRAYLTEHPDKGITYHGVVSRDELPQILVNADLTLIPLVKNIYGAVPSKIYESMAAGLPIMFMGDGEGARIVRDNGLGLVAGPKDYDGFRANLATVAANPDLVRQMADNCRACAADKFNRPRQIADLAHYLESQLKGRLDNKC